MELVAWLFIGVLLVTALVMIYKIGFVKGRTAALLETNETLRNIAARNIAALTKKHGEPYE